MENNRERLERSIQVPDDVLDKMITEEVLDRFRSGVGKILVPIMKDGRTAGRKWAVEDANFEQLWRMAEYSRKDYANLDMVSDTRPLYSFSEPSLGDIIGYTTDETLEELIGTNADDDHRDKIRELLESARESERLHHARARRLESSLTLAI